MTVLWSNDIRHCLLSTREWPAVILRVGLLSGTRNTCWNAQDRQAFKTHDGEVGAGSGSRKQTKHKLPPGHDRQRRVQTGTALIASMRQCNPGLPCFEPSIPVYPSRSQSIPVVRSPSQPPVQVTPPPLTLLVRTGRSIRTVAVLTLDREFSNPIDTAVIMDPRRPNQGRRSGS